MSIFRQLAIKPWEDESDPALELPEGREFPLARGSVALRFLIAVMSVLFTLLIVTYADRMLIPDWQPVQEPWMLWWNTAMLILASVALQWATNKTAKGDMATARKGLLAGGGLTAVFLVGQVLVWMQLANSGIFAHTNPSAAFFYLLTIIHALHVLGGMFAWLRTANKAWGEASQAEVSLHIELCTFYWHFLLIVWLVLFSLLSFT